MPDTGAPWNIPYADPTDLVRDWPALSEDVAEAVADGLAFASVGLGTNVTQKVLATPFTTASTSWTDITDLDGSITPSSTDSKVLVIVQFNVSGTAAGRIQTRLLRGSTVIYTGTVAGSRTGGLTTMFGNATSAPFNYRTDFDQHMSTAVYLDSPNTAASVTYKMQMILSAGTGTVNTTAGDSDDAGTTRTASSVTLIEVAA